MKAKLIYTTLIGLLVSSGVSNAMQSDFSRLSLTDGRESGNQMTPYRTNSQVTSSFQGGGQAISETNVDFTNASQQRVKMTFQYPGTGDNIQIDGMIRYMGQNIDGLSHFAKYLNGWLAQYNPGMDLSPAKDIVVTGEDSINLAAFAKYAPQNLFYNWIKEDDIKLLTPEFKAFKDSREKPFGSITHDDNCIMFSMMYYPKSVHIQNTYYKYNNLDFIFSPCPEDQKNSGKKVDAFAFKTSDFSYDSSAKLHPNTKDTLARTLSSPGGYGGYAALYQYTAFKLEDGLYRLNVKLSSQESASSLASQEFVDRKITNFLLNIK